MKFCKQCRNMLYDKVDATEKIPRLIYTCRKCGYVEEAPSGAVKVSETNTDSDQASYMQYVLPNLKYEATLPRTNMIACINPKCSKEASQANEVIYINYDPVNLKYLYHCVYCESYWKHGEQGILNIKENETRS